MEIKEQDYFRKYRWGFDLGESSIGWTVVDMDNTGFLKNIIDIGVVHFPTGRKPDGDRKPLSVGRRICRSRRRSLARKKIRVQSIIHHLVRSGFITEDDLGDGNFANIDPYKARAEAATIGHESELKEIARAFFHISQRRGFKSNRRVDANNDKLTATKIGMMELDKSLGDQTLGQWLYQQRQKNGRTRFIPTSGSNPDKLAWDFFPKRKHYEDEFKRIWDNQKIHYPEIMNDNTRKSIHHSIFFQRPLKKPPSGKCSLEKNESRLDWAHPEAQKFRILQEVNNLEWRDLNNTFQKIRTEERALICQVLLAADRSIISKQGILNFNKARSLLKKPKGYEFNLDAFNRKGIQCDLTSWAFMSNPDTALFWKSLSPESRVSLISLIISDTSDDELICLIKDNFSISTELAQIIINLHLPTDKCRFSLVALRKIIPLMEKGLPLNSAILEAGYKLNDWSDGTESHLPYYGEVLQEALLPGNPTFDPIKFPEKHFGRIGNITVHIGLNQLRKLINALLKKHGHPESISVEIASELNMSQDQKRRHQETIKKNTELHVEADEIIKLNGLSVNASNRMRYRLWYDLSPSSPIERACPYCGKTISKCEIFSSAFEVEHIIPFSISYDDTRNNKVLSCRSCNKRKGNKSPYDAFGHYPEWSEIVARADRMSPAKSAKFNANAIGKFLGSVKVNQGIKDQSHVDECGEHEIELFEA